MEIVRISGVELTYEEALKLYQSGRKFLVTYSKITEIVEGRNGEMKGKVIYIQKGGKLAKRGRFHALSWKEVQSLLYGTDQKVEVEA